MEIFTVGAVRLSDVHPDILGLAQSLAVLHGEQHICRESGGVHIYMASPACLEKEGHIELQKKHLAVNADKFYGLGKWQGRVGTYDRDICAYCMKTETPFRVSELLSLPPLKDRGFQNTVAKISISVRERVLVDDGRGNMIPDHPGQVIPITQLNPDHVAVRYLLDRGFDLQLLYDMFRTSYCCGEAPEDREQGRFYKRCLGKFRDTPQGRIIFYGDIKGIQKVWQARVLDKVQSERLLYHFHPYEQRWVLTHMRQSKEEKWQLMPNLVAEQQAALTRGFTLNWSLSKYKTAFNAARNEALFGYDAAVAWNKANRSYEDRVAVLVEGPLDAAKGGPPCIALAGKFLSAAQFALLEERFHGLILIRDNDEAGMNAEACLKERAQGSKVKAVVATVPGDIKDLGDMSLEEAQKLVKKQIEGLPP